LPPPPETRVARRPPLAASPLHTPPPPVPRPSPDDAEQQIARAEAKFHDGDFVDAQTAAEKAVKMAPSARTLVLLGNILLQDEQFTEAAASFNRALGLDPDNALARRGLEHARARLHR